MLGTTVYNAKRATKEALRTRQEGFRAREGERFQLKLSPSLDYWPGSCSCSWVLSASVPQDCRHSGKHSSLKSPNRSGRVALSTHTQATVSRSRSTHNQAHLGHHKESIVRPCRRRPLRLTWSSTLPEPMKYSLSGAWTLLLSTSTAPADTCSCRKKEWASPSTPRTLSGACRFSCSSQFRREIEIDRTEQREGEGGGERGRRGDDSPRVGSVLQSTCAGYSRSPAWLIRFVHFDPGTSKANTLTSTKLQSHKARKLRETTPVEDTIFFITIAHGSSLRQPPKIGNTLAAGGECKKTTQHAKRPITAEVRYKRRSLGSWDTGSARGGPAQH